MSKENKLYSDKVYNPKEIKHEDYVPLHLKCFLIRTLQGICVAKFIVNDKCIELVMDSTTGTERETEHHTQTYGKNMLYENDFVMDVVKSLRYKEINGKKEIVSDCYRVVPITDEQYNKLYNLITLQGFCKTVPFRRRQRTRQPFLQ